MTSKQRRPDASHRVIDVGSPPSKAPAYDQSGYVVKKVTPTFVKVLQLLNENIDLCINQCRSYKEAWYPQGQVADPVNMKYQLTDSMSSNLEIIKKNYEQLKSNELRDVLIPGATQSKCEHFIIRLAGLHEELYMRAISYHSVYNDLDAILNETASKKNELNNEMIDCRQ